MNRFLNNLFCSGKIDDFAGMGLKTVGAGQITIQGHLDLWNDQFHQFHQLPQLLQSLQLFQLPQLPQLPQYGKAHLFSCWISLTISWRTEFFTSMFFVLFIMGSPHDVPKNLYDLKTCLNFYESKPTFPIKSLISFSFFPCLRSLRSISVLKALIYFTASRY